MKARSERPFPVPRRENLRLERLDGAANADDEAAAADACNDRGGVGRVFKDLQTHRRMTGNEIVVIKRMHKYPFDPGERTFLKGLPRDFIRHGNQSRAKRLHTLDFRHGRRLEHDNRARNACLFCRVSNALSGISGAYRPYTALTLGI